MDQFQHVGEALGSLRALMVMRDDIPINQRQCCLLLEMFSLAFDLISEGIRSNLKLEEKSIKWKALEDPLREICRVFREGESYVRRCTDGKDWWGKAVTYHQNKDCVEFHVHDLLCYFPTVVEAIETAGEISGLDEGEMGRKRVLLRKKYDREWNDPRLFGLYFGREYLVTREVCYRLEGAWREDRWLLVEALREMKNPEILSRNECRLADVLIRKLNQNQNQNGSSEFKLPPSSVLLGSKDYAVRRRLGKGNQYKEISWLGEQFALRQFHGEAEPLTGEIRALLSLSHPNILQCLVGFHDEDKSEFYLVMELMNKNVYNHMKEHCGARRQLLFSIPVVVDILLQIARGMEYLHAREIYHGDLNPSTVLLKPRYLTEGYFHAKVAGFGLRELNPPEDDGASQSSNVWLAPEVLEEKEQKESKNKTNLRYSEKADVYSFGMLAFDLLTGKIPFEDGYLPGDKSCRNIRAGGRPLFPFTTPKYLVNLTKKCWHSDPAQRPSFSSVCRILRYTKRFIAMNAPSENGQPQLQVPPVEYLDLEASFLKKGFEDVRSVSQVPFQMFSYKVLERARNGVSENDRVELENGNEDPTVEDSDLRSVCSEIEDRRIFAAGDTRSVWSEVPDSRGLSLVGVKDLSIRDKSEIRELLTSSESSDATSKKTHLTSVLPEIPETKSSSPRSPSKQCRSPKTKALQSKDSSSVSSVSPRKKSSTDRLTRSSSDMIPRPSHSEPPRRKGLSLSASSSALDKSALATFKERRALPEPPTKMKRMLSLKMTKNVKVRQGQDSSKSSSWNPCGRSVNKIGRDTKLNKVASPKKRAVSGSSATSQAAETS